jgi:hypothetical protein
MVNRQTSLYTITLMTNFQTIVNKYKPISVCFYCIELYFCLKLNISRMTLTEITYGINGAQKIKTLLTSL